MTVYYNYLCVCVCVLYCVWYYYLYDDCLLLLVFSCAFTYYCIIHVFCCLWEWGFPSPLTSIGRCRAFNTNKRLLTPHFYRLRPAAMSKLCTRSCVNSPRAPLLAPALARRDRAGLFKREGRQDVHMSLLFV